MKSSLAFLFLLAALVMGTTWIGVSPSRGEPLRRTSTEAPTLFHASSASASTATPTSARAPRPQASFSGVAATEKQNPIASYLSARSQTQAMAAIRVAEQRGLSGAIDARMQLEDLCRRAPERSERDARRDHATNERLNAYCDARDEVAPLDAAQADSQFVKGSIGQTRALLGDVRDAYGDEPFATEIKHIIETAPDPFAVRAALEMAAESETLPARFADYLSPNTLRSETIDWRSALHALAMIEFCRIGNGCGPGSATSLSACSVLGHCEQNLAAVEQVRRTFPPNAFEAAMQISSELERRRASHGVRP